MKIYGNNNVGNIKTYASEVESKRRSKEADASAFFPETSKNKDEVLLSENAVQFVMFKGRLSSLPDVRSDKVAELRSQIQSGDYEVDSEKVADKLIEETLLVK